MPFGQHPPMPPAASPMLGDSVLFVGNTNVSGYHQRPRSGGTGSGKATSPPARAVSVISASMAAVQTAL